jgi:predicted nucleic acid-binding protein
MIAADTSTWVAYLEGATEDDARLLRQALVDKQAVMVPVVLTELVSDPDLPPEVGAALLDLPLIEIRAGYWQRAGRLRAKVLALGRRARLGDALIAQCCIDEEVPLLTRDHDFGVFSEAAGVDLLIRY